MVGCWHISYEFWWHIRSKTTFKNCVLSTDSMTDETRKWIVSLRAQVICKVLPLASGIARSTRGRMRAFASCAQIDSYASMCVERACLHMDVCTGRACRSQSTARDAFVFNFFLASAHCCATVLFRKCIFETRDACMRCEDNQMEYKNALRLRLRSFTFAMRLTKSDEYMAF